MVDSRDKSGGTLPLAPGASGNAVRDLQARLRRGGFLGVHEVNGDYDDRTQIAVIAFQDRSGLHASGICDEPTWSALVESGFELGDRLLYHRSPMLRGDDVAAVQRRLSELGFHGGRVDGIFGPDTECAVVAFQRNTGLVTDGVVGPDVLAQLRRLGPGSDLVTKAELIERLSLERAPHRLSDARIVVCESGSLPALVRSISRQLDQAGARTLAVHHPESSAQAAEANRFDARCFIGFASRSAPGSSLSYYRTDGYESLGGHHLADVLAQSLIAIDAPGPVEVRGMRTPILRETRMPALWCEIGTASWLVEHTALVAQAMAQGLATWMNSPLTESS